MGLFDRLAERSNVGRVDTGRREAERVDDTAREAAQYRLERLLSVDRVAPRELRERLDSILCLSLKGAHAISERGGWTTQQAHCQ